MAESDNAGPAWDEDLAVELVGSLVVAAITHLGHDGKFVRQEQMFGKVIVAEQQRGVCLQLEGTRTGDFQWLPPATDFFRRASPGVYKLKSTGEEVADPDFLVLYSVKAPPPSWKIEGEESGGDKNPR